MTSAERRSARSNATGPRTRLQLEFRGYSERSFAPTNNIPTDDQSMIHQIFWIGTALCLAAIAIYL